VLLCRRRYDGAPPLAPAEPSLGRPAACETGPAESPRGESLKDTYERVLPYWRESILPEVRAGKRVLIVSHRNTLCVLVKILDAVTDRDTPRLKPPTGRPLVYELGPDLKPLSHFYVQSPERGKDRSRTAARTR
jgi:2,3-bisphosphoglycerate-dependent phosphoglycerate mutase